MTNDANYELLWHLEFLMAFSKAQTTVDDFTAHLLALLGYVSRNKVVRTQADIPLAICSEQRRAHIDICIADLNDIILLVLENKQMELKDSEAQLIAAALAAFQGNNVRRWRLCDKASLAPKVVPGIIMTGSSPTFYRIPITAELADAVSLGVYPASPTVVYAHLPVLHRPGLRQTEGMRPLDNRYCILGCFEAFKRFVKWYDSYDSI